MNASFLTTLRVFVPFAAGYFLSYLYRVVNAVIAPDLVGDLGIGPSALGLLTATYFISFASSQLPLGVLLDRFGPRRMEAFLLLFAGLGAYLFSRSGSLAGLVVARAFIGFGVSACLMAAFKAYTLWFPKERWPLVNGFQMAAGGLGALAATAPVEAALQVTDWRGVFMVLAVLTLLVAVAVYTVVPEKPSSGAGESFKHQLQGVKTVFTSLEFWRAAPLTTLSQASFLSIQGLWAGPWLKDVAGLDRMAVANVLLWIAVAMIAGFILLGSLAERLSRSGISVLTTAVTGMGLFMGVQVLVLAGAGALGLAHVGAVRLFRHVGYHRLCSPLPAVSGAVVRPGHHRRQSAGVHRRLPGAVGHRGHHRPLAGRCRRKIRPGGLSQRFFCHVGPSGDDLDLVFHGQPHDQEPQKGVMAFNGHRQPKGGQT